MLIIAGVAALLLLAVLYHYAKAAATKVDRRVRVDMIKVCLYQYVRDNGVFPVSLDAMMKAQDQDASLLRFGPGVSLKYIQPSTNAPETTEVLVLTYPGNKIVATKDFNVTTSP
jgi:hypothetical protein